MSHTLFPIPDFCPICGGTAEIDGSFLYCRSRSCPSKLSGSLKVWVSRLGLLHWGDSLIESLTDGDHPAVSSISGLYELTVEQIADHCSGLKFAKKCYEILHSQKRVKLETVLSALNIPNLGIATSTDIVKAGFDSADKVIALSEKDLVNIPNIGTVTASHLFFGIQGKRDEILSLSKVLTIEGPSNGPLSGMSFCITGSTSIPRKALQKKIVDSGGIIKESVTAGLNFLVTNEDKSFGSSKMKKAESFGTKVISEQELSQMMVQ